MVLIVFLLFRHHWLEIWNETKPVVGVRGQSGDERGKEDGEDDAECDAACSADVLRDRELGHFDSIEEEPAKRETTGEKCRN